MPHLWPLAVLRDDTENEWCTKQLLIKRRDWPNKEELAQEWRMFFDEASCLRMLDPESHRYRPDIHASKWPSNGGGGGAAAGTSTSAPSAGAPSGPGLWDAAKKAIGTAFGAAGAKPPPRPTPTSQAALSRFAAPPAHNGAHHTSPTTPTMTSHATSHAMMPHATPHSAAQALHSLAVPHPTSGAAHAEKQHTAVVRPTQG